MGLALFATGKVVYTLTYGSTYKELLNERTKRQSVYICAICGQNTDLQQQAHQFITASTVSSSRRHSEFFEKHSELQLSSQ